MDLNTHSTPEEKIMPFRSLFFQLLRLKTRGKVLAKDFNGNVLDGFTAS